MQQRRMGQILAVVVFVLTVAAHGPAAAQAPATRRAVFTAEQLMKDVATLAAPEMQGRETGTAGNARAREWIAEQFREAGLEPLDGRYEHPFTFERRPRGNREGDPVTIRGVNIAGICRGTGAADNGAMVISAHYDHVGVREGVVYHGADDNASGVAVLLALARQCEASPWQHDAIFVAFDAEEMGLQGARAFVAQRPIPSDRTIALNINLDMVARGDTGELYVAGASHRPVFRTILEPVAARAPVKLLFGHDTGSGRDDWTMLSDHGAFHEAGIPFVYFGVEDHPDYHKPTDTADRIDPKFFHGAALTILDAVTAIDRALPLSAR